MSLQSILRERNVEAYRVTKKLLTIYAVVLDAVFDSLKTGYSVKWANIDFHPSNRAVINVIGMLYHKPGDMIRNEGNGEIIYIDETNADNYSRPIRMLVPVHQLESMDVGGMILFLQETSAVIEQSSHDELDIMLADDVFITKTFTAFKTKREQEKDTPKAIEVMGDSNKVIGRGGEAHPVKTAPKNLYEGFDLDKSELDDIQLLTLKLLRPEGQA